MTNTKIYITIRTQKMHDDERGVVDTHERMASGVLTEEEATNLVKLSKDVLEKIFHDAEFVED